MVSSIEVRPFGTRHLDVVVDSKRFGSIELDGKLFLAKGYAQPSEWFRTQQEAVDHIVEVVGKARARWQRALGRAIAEGLDPVEVAGVENAYFVASGSNLNVAYLVTNRGKSCSCPAGQSGDKVCKHRAAVRFIIGHLDVVADEVEAAAPIAAVVEVAPVACAKCVGSGREWVSRWNGRGSVNGWWESCLVCNGQGQLAA